MSAEGVSAPECIGLMAGENPERILRTQDATLVERRAVGATNHVHIPPSTLVVDLGLRLPRGKHFPVRMNGVEFGAWLELVFWLICRAKHDLGLSRLWSTKVDLG